MNYAGTNRHRMLALLALLLVPRIASSQPATPGEAELTFEIKRESILQHDDGKCLWFHPRAAAIHALSDDKTTVIMTLQKHLRVSDHYSGLFTMRTDDLGGKWTAPAEEPQLGWVSQGGVDVAVADVTPGWHALTNKLIAVGARVRYSRQGKQLEDVRRAHQTAYAVLDPLSREWSKWKLLEMPPQDEFNFARSACAQWLVEPDGSVLLPFYHGESARVPWSATVVQCTFDGTELKFQRHGSILPLASGRGFAEPSLAKFQERYYLTIRSNNRAWVAVSDDGLQFTPPKPWLFDDGQELGSYNTQQHWVTHSDGLFLSYTRRGAENDHIMRNRAPLFIAKVEAKEHTIIRETERVLIPERGAQLGNFGAAAINRNESWVTVAEYVRDDDARRRGADGSLFVARIIWSKPNYSAPRVAGGP